MPVFRKATISYLSSSPHIASVNSVKRWPRLHSSSMPLAVSRSWQMVLLRE